MRILERDDCTLDLTVGDRIEYDLDAGGQHIVVGSAGVVATTSLWTWFNSD